MSSGESHAVRNGIIATVVGGVALAILAEIWAPIKIVISWFWGQLLALAGLFGDSYSVPGWALSILGFLALVTVVRAIVALRISPVVPHGNYVEDILFSVKWRWSWVGEEVSNLWCFCPVCDGELVYDDSSVYNIYSRDEPHTLLICEHCNRNTMGRVDGGGKDYALDAVRREIRRRVRTGKYLEDQRGQVQIKG